MAATKQKSGTRERQRQKSGGHKPRSRKHSANGSGNGRAHNGNGSAVLPATDPLARDLIAAVASSGVAPAQEASDAEVKVTKAQARKIAVEFGGAMLEATNRETAEHSDDVVVLTRAIVEQLGIKGTEKQDILAAARLHDIGKAAVPIEVLEKPGPLNDDEWALMRQHTLVGHQILGAVSELEGIARLVRHSHERWDGRGYPDGLAGEDIPLGSRIIFCADAFHAIRSDRPYRAGRTAAASMAEVKRSAGTQFDPEVVRAFQSVAKDLKLSPSATAFRRSSRLTALLLMLSIGTAGSAIAASGILGEPTFSSQSPGEAPAAPAFGSGQMLGISFDDAIQINRASATSRSFVFGGGSALALEQGGRPDQGGRIDTPGGGSRPSDASSPAGSGGDAQSSEGGSRPTDSSEPDNSGQSDSEHPQGGAPGQTGNHPQGGPPGQTGSKPGKGNSGGGGTGSSGQGSSGSGHPHGGPPGQTGNHPGKGNGGSSGNSGSPGSGGSSGSSGSTGSSGGGGSSGSSGSSGSNGSGPSGSGPPGQSKKPK